MQKATYNPDTITLMGQHYQQLYNTLVSTPEDEDVFNDRANHFYQIREDLISIPDYLPDTEQEEDLSIVNRLKAQICRT